MHGVDWEPFAVPFQSSQLEVASYTIASSSSKQITPFGSFDAPLLSTLPLSDYDELGTTMYDGSVSHAYDVSSAHSPTNAIGDANLFGVYEQSASGVEGHYMGTSIGTSPFSSLRQLDLGTSPITLLGTEDSQFDADILKGSSFVHGANDFPKKSITSISPIPTSALDDPQVRVYAGAMNHTDYESPIESISPSSTSPSLTCDSLPGQQIDDAFAGDLDHPKIKRRDAHDVKDGPLTQQELQTILSVHEVKSATVVNGAGRTFILHLEVNKPIRRDAKTEKEVEFIGFPSKALVEKLLKVGPLKDKAKGLFICECGRSYTKSCNWSRHVKTMHGPVHS